jgi:hypothetical protein
VVGERAATATPGRTNEGRGPPTAICRRTDLSKHYAASASFMAPEPQTVGVPENAGSVVLRTALEAVSEEVVFEAKMAPRP